MKITEDKMKDIGSHLKVQLSVRNSAKSEIVSAIPEYFRQSDEHGFPLDDTLFTIGEIMRTRPIMQGLIVRFLFDAGDNGEAHFHKTDLVGVIESDYNTTFTHHLDKT